MTVMETTSGKISSAALAKDVSARLDAAVARGVAQADVAKRGERAEWHKEFAALSARLDQLEAKIAEERRAGL